MTKKSQKMMFNVLSIALHVLLNIIFYAVVIYLISKASKYAYRFAYQIFGSVSVTKEATFRTVVEIKKGDSTMKLAEELERKRIIINKNSFYIRAKLSKSNIIPGKYSLDSSMDYEEIFNIITNTKKNEEVIK